jgi:hypothetical protein
LPFATVAALVAAGLGEKNSRGTLDVNHVGRRYLEAKGLRAIREVPRRNRSSAI